MRDGNAQNLRSLHIRAELPRYVRAGALIVLALTIALIAIGYFMTRSEPEFRMKGFPTELSKEVVASVDGYERKEVDGDVVKYYIKADRAVTFSDNHQEMDNVFLQVFAPAGEGSDTITAKKAVYLPTENENFKVYVSGDVNIITRDDLNVKTTELVYDKSDESATVEAKLDFQRKNVTGNAVGAVVMVAKKTLELKRDVKIETKADPSAPSDFTTANIEAGRAFYEQVENKIRLEDGLIVKIQGGGESPKRVTDIRALKAMVYLAEKPAETETQAAAAPAPQTALSATPGDFKRIELFEQIEIETREKPEQTPTRIWAGYANYEKDADRFDLKNSSRIVTVEDGTQTNISAMDMVYERKNGKVFLNLNAEISQGGDLVKGDQINADLYPNRRLKSAAVNGNGYLRQMTPERQTEVSGPALFAAFAEDQKLTRAESNGASTVVMIPANTGEYSRASVSAQNSIGVDFRTAGRIEKIQTQGRTTLNLNAPPNTPDAANRRLTADAVKTFFDNEGRFLRRAEAIGNAELIADPVTPGVEHYKTTITAPRFDCVFFETGNNARECVAASKTKTVRVPTVARDGRSNQIITAEKLTSRFNEKTRDVETLSAAGSAKFTELDRNSVADEFVFTAGDGIVKLRGGEPAAWDSAARAKAREIDWDTRNQKSYFRGGVSSTYYSQAKTGGAAPFGATEKPVYLTSNTATFDHRTETGIFEGNARGWQESNYVRAEKIVIEQSKGLFSAEGSVQSMLYNARRREKDRDVQVPVYASSRRMHYNREANSLRYEGDVDIRQENDRITAGIANIYLDNSGEVSRTDVEQSVVITQPNRIARGDSAQYFAADEKMILRGNPAKVDDATQGSSQGGEITMYLRENRILGEGKSNKNPAGRVRSVYKIKNN